MRRPFHSNSQGFRAVLVLALLAWATLASGALAAPFRMGATMPLSTPHAAAAVAHCDGPMAHAATQRGHVPVTPMGHGDCCNGGCHCLSACNVVLAVPRLSVFAQSWHAPLPALLSVAPAQVPTAPPLRPPIA